MEILTAQGSKRWGTSWLADGSQPTQCLILRSGEGWLRPLRSLVARASAEFAGGAPHGHRPRVGAATAGHGTHADVGPPPRPQSCASALCQVARIAGQPQPDRPLVHDHVRTAFDVPSRTWWRGLSHCHRASAYSAMPDLPPPMYPHPELGCGCDERSERRFGAPVVYSRANCVGGPDCIPRRENQPRPFPVYPQIADIDRISRTGPATSTCETVELQIPAIRQTSTIVASHMNACTEPGRSAITSPDGNQLAAFSPREAAWEVVDGESAVNSFSTPLSKT